MSFTIIPLVGKLTVLEGEAFYNKLGEVLNKDEIQIAVRRQLFEIEKNLSPVDVIFLYMVIKRVGELADNAQTVGGRLHLLLAR